MFKRVVNALKYYGRKDKPGRYFAALFLQKTHLSSLILIRRKFYTIRFYPQSGLARELWIYPKRRLSEEKFLETYLRPGDTVVDVGANIGTIALTAAALVGSTGRVIAIEPHPRIFQYLTAQRTLNHATKLEIVQSAVGDHQGSVHFSNRGADVMNSVTDDGTLTVPLDTLDHLLAPFQIDHVDFLKIDVEGFEKAVLSGAQQTLALTNALYIETLEEGLAHYGSSKQEICQLLRDHGFRLYHLNRTLSDVFALRSPEAVADRTAALVIEEIVP